MPSLLNKNVLLFLALVALMVSVFLKPMMLSRPVYSFLVTFDISQSMNVRDMSVNKKTANRLTVSKAAAQHLLESLPCGSSIGWSLFTGRRAVLLVAPVEVCDHYDALSSSLGLIDERMRWANASGVGKGLHQSMRAADAIGNDTQVVFMTDGQEAPPLREGSRGMPKTDRIDATGIIVGVGGITPARIPKTTDENGTVTSYWNADEVVQRTGQSFGPSHEELSRRQDSHLSQLSRLSELSYLPLDAAPQLAAAAMIPTLASYEKVPVDLRWVPASIALFLLFCRFAPNVRAASSSRQK